MHTYEKQSLHLYVCIYTYMTCIHLFYILYFAASPNNWHLAILMQLARCAFFFLFWVKGIFRKVMLEGEERETRAAAPRGLSITKKIIDGVDAVMAVLMYFNLTSLL